MDLDFQLSAVPSLQSNLPDLSLADESTLRYDILLGDITFRADTCDFSTHWGWIPLIDFAISLLQTMDDLTRGDEAKSLIDFTESDAKVVLCRSGDLVLITSSYTPCRAEILLDEFTAAGTVFLQRLLDQVKQAYSALLKNKEFLRLLRLSDQDTPAATGFSHKIHPQH